MAVPVPRVHHIDKRAEEIASQGAGSPDDLLREVQVASWLGVSQQWIQIGRHAGYGPQFIKVGRLVRYRRADVLRWLEERSHQSAAEYRTPPPTKRTPLVRRPAVPSLNPNQENQHDGEPN